MGKIVEYFTLKSRVSSYDVGPERRIRPSVVLRLFQETAGRQLEQAGMGYEALRGHGMVFLLTGVGLRVRRMPAFTETVETTTWFCGTQGVRFLRGMRLTAGGETCVELGSHWVLAEPEGHRPLRPSAYPSPETMPPVAGDPMPVTLQKLKPALFSDQACPAAPRPVRWSDLDYNGHVNNAVYADILCDCFPGGYDGRTLAGLQIDYLAEALPGDIIEVRAKREGQTTLFEGRISSRPCFTARTESAF